MEQDNRKGRLCGLIAAGLRLEGLLRVAMERPDVETDAEQSIREAFAMYSALFAGLFPEAEPESEPLPEACEESNSGRPDGAPVAAAGETGDATDEAGCAADEPESAEEVPAATYTPVEEACPAARPLSEALKVDELIARKESADLRRAFTLNDKFRFRRTIFGGSDERFSSTLVALEQQPDFDSALELLAGVLPENGEDNEDFLAIVKAHFESRQ